MPMYDITSRIIFQALFTVFSIYFAYFIKNPTYTKLYAADLTFFTPEYSKNSIIFSVCSCNNGRNVL